MENNKFKALKPLLRVGAALIVLLSVYCTACSKGTGEGDEPPTPEPKGEDYSAYSWPAYSPTISYNFKDEYPALPQPTTVLDDCPEVTKTYTGKWWCFRMGKDANPLVTEAAIKPMLDYFDSEFTYFRETMGWPMDIRARNGFFSSIYLFGSGLCTDQAPNTALGGWMGSIDHAGRSWPMVLASYYPVYSFDPANNYGDAHFQRGAMIHEGIHAMIADYDGVKNSAWFHEGGNVWFQQTADSKRSGVYESFGFLNAADVIAPFIPIECYSGWLLDGSFGGPSAEGVNMFNGNQQLCTWRRLLGGKQYSSMFPTFVGLILGDSAVPWIWRNAKNRVLEGMADGIGAEAIRRFITEYRAKQATLDWGEWRNAYRSLLNDNFGQETKEEWAPFSQAVQPWKMTPYVKSTNNNGVLIPDRLTLPGWSGANQIPLKIKPGTSHVELEFTALSENMTCQLVYRDVDDKPVYSKFVSGGKCAITLSQRPANDVVIAVIANNDYVYEGDATRKKKFNYRIKLGEGIESTADVNVKWYEFNALGSNRNNSSKVQKAGIDWSKFCTHRSHQLVHLHL